MIFAMVRLRWVVMYKIVVPGDFLSTDIRRAGEGTYVENGKVYALRYGILDDKDEIRVVPLSGRYIPKRGDVVIGRVEDIMYPYWVFDIASPYKGLLHVSEFPAKVEYGTMDRFLRIDDLAIVKVVNVDPMMRVELKLVEEFRPPLHGGRLIEVPHTKIPRIIGRNGSMIKILKEEGRCFIFVAKNGRIWIRGNERNVDLVAEIIMKIAEKAHTSGLTDRVTQYLRAARGGKNVVRNKAH